MIDINKYNLDNDDKELIDDMLYAFSHNEDMRFTYNGKKYFISYENYENGKIQVSEFYDGAPISLFDNPDDFFAHYAIDGKPFLELLPDITTFDCI